MCVTPRDCEVEKHLTAKLQAGIWRCEADRATHVQVSTGTDTLTAAKNFLETQTLVGRPSSITDPGKVEL